MKVVLAMGGTARRTWRWRARARSEREAGSCSAPRRTNGGRAVDRLTLGAAAEGLLLRDRACNPSWRLKEAVPLSHTGGRPLGVAREKVGDTQERDR